MKSEELLIKPIAHIETDFKEKFGIPRQSGRVEALKGRIVFETKYRNPDALRGLKEFSHIWLIFDFSKSHREEWSPTVRPPRLGGNKKIGVFASRSPFRPNPLGLSVVALDSIENTQKDGYVLNVSGIDLLDNTPIYDIKPYIPYADAKINAKGSYSDSFKNYSLEVDFPEELLSLIPKEKQKALLDCLADDPRPSYQEDTRVYKMSFAGFDISFKVFNGVLTVTEVVKI